MKYKVVKSSDMDSFEAMLNALAEEGWRVQSYQPVNLDRGLVYTAVLAKERA